jgi:hypothetical protein
MTPEGGNCAHRVALLAVAASVIATLLAFTNSALAQTAGTATAVQGQVQLQRAGATSNLTQGAAIQVGDRIVTGPNSSATITLTDQSRLEIRDSSTVTIDQHLVGAGGRVNTQIGLVSGLLRSFVHLTSAGGVPNFSVHTPNAIAAARGTTYDTDYRAGIQRPAYPNCADFTDVSVSEGVVEVRNALNTTTPAVEVRPGYTTSVPCALAPLLPAAVGTTGGGGVGGFTGVSPGGSSAPPPPLPPPPPPPPSGGGFPG